MMFFKVFFYLIFREHYCSANHKYKTRNIDDNFTSDKNASLWDYTVNGFI